MEKGESVSVAFDVALPPQLEDHQRPQWDPQVLFPGNMVVHEPAYHLRPEESAAAEGFTAEEILHERAQAAAQPF